MGKTMNAAYLGVLLVLCTTACVPAFPKGAARSPNTQVPLSYGGITDSTNSAQTTWRDFYHDPKLGELIDAAIRNNQELNILTAELDIAENEIMARRGEYYPKVGLRAGLGIDKVGTYSSQGVSDDANGVAQNLPSFGLGLAASWEIDIWKKLRNQTKSATIRYLATREGRHLAITNLVAEIASSYYELQALYATLDVVKQNIALQQRALTVVRLQKEAARVTELAVKRFEAEVLKNQSRQYAIAQQMVETENRINFLLGRFPQPIDLQRDHFADQLPPILHAGIPSQLLENRPDVKQAWLEILAANLDVKIAKASFYPALGINATLGLQSFDPLKLVSFPASLVYGLAADLMVPLINRKAITANYFSANSRELQAVYHYERAILSGFVEVSKLLSMVYNLEQSYNLKTQEVEKLTQSIDISGRLFSSARADYMEVLLTRRDALEAQLELIENKKRQLLAAVSLYRALGGGWR